MLDGSRGRVRALLLVVVYRGEDCGEVFDDIRFTHRDVGMIRIR